MKTFTQLSTLAAEYPKLATQLSCWIPAADIHKSFQWNLGGDVYVVESQEEYLSMFADNAPFDIVEEDWVPGWSMLALINNNSGGPTWFVHKDILGE